MNFLLGFLVEFISMPVTVGFTSAAAVTIASSQIKGLLGLPGEARAFLDSWINFFTNVLELRPWDTTLGICTIIILIIAKVSPIFEIFYYLILLILILLIYL